MPYQDYFPEYGNRDRFMEMGDTRMVATATEVDANANVHGEVLWSDTLA